MNRKRIPKDKTINAARARQLFREHAILLTDTETDAVPEEIVIDIFGKQAVEYAQNFNDAEQTTYGIRAADELMTGYITESGFYLAAIYHNVQATGAPIFEELDK